MRASSPSCNRARGRRRRRTNNWDARAYATNARFVADYGRDVAAVLAARRGERVLDVGCGDGALTAELARDGAIVVGIDGAPDMVAAAVARGVDARVCDGRALAFDREFDAAFSNAALHWMVDVPAVLRGVRRALVPGGRFVGELGGHGNVAAIVTALLAALAECGIDGRPRIPWTFPTSEAFAADLERAGFAVGSTALVSRPTPLPTGMNGWLATFANPFFAGLGEARRRDVAARATDLLAWSLCDANGRWTADYVRLRFSAVARDGTEVSRPRSRVTRSP